ncbi:MAG: tetratricopeptide repeat protein [Candidatus Obscuribacterales bacterium]|nr:tetratricopeptide repeat protein [Candidatus Obscuribacterales bacterium]
MRVATNNVLLSVLLTLGLGTSSASATDYYKQACEHYAKGEHHKAKHLFSHITAHRPDHAAALYHLGNTCVKLGHYDEAKSAYERCIEIADPTTKAHCLTGLHHIAQIDVRKKAHADKLAKSESRKLDIEKEAYQAHKTKVLELERKREAILKEARQKADKVIADADRRIEVENESTNQFIQNTVTGEVRIGLTSQEKDDIRGQAHDEAARIMDHAMVIIRGIQTPPEPNVDPGVKTAIDSGKPEEAELTKKPGVRRLSGHPTLKTY